MSRELPDGYRLPDDLAAGVRAALEQAAAERWVQRTWEKDASLWSSDPEVQALVGERLGWLRVPEEFLDHPEELNAFAAGVRAEGFRAAVLLGMGGSSLAPRVLLDTFGTIEDGLDFHVLDSTDPAAVAQVQDATDPASTLYLVSTKSGTTVETLSLLAFFWDAVHHRGGGPTEEHFAAITDPDRSLKAIPRSEDFRSLFLNPPDVGGRYSALTHVGLVPAALLELDLAEILARGVSMAQRCREDGLDNPGLVLGLALGTLARAGRDKLTVWADPSIESVGAWIEQLVAESTGKEGTGIVPVVGEPLGSAGCYGTDRVFVRLLREGGDAAPDWRAATDALTAELTALGHPVIDLEVPVPEALGGEFFRWEFATAIAGAVLGVNPFDEPNVAESKRNTQAALDERRAGGARPWRGVHATEESLAAELRDHLARLVPSGYASLQAYVAPTPERDAALARIRALIRDRTRRATTAGYGPRFLHSTGQLHKGGAPSGWFLQLVGGHPPDADLAIPGAGHTFGALIDAQADGDLASLEARGLPVLRVHLGDDPDAGLAAVEAAIGPVLEATAAAG